VNSWSRAALTGTPQDAILDVTIIPLSALDTVLPKGAPALPAPLQPPPPQRIEQLQKPKEIQVAPQPSKPKAVEQKKIVASKSLNPLTLRPAQEDNSTAQPSTAAVATNSHQQLGVANGQAISIEQARISYQDMVATMLARAKRYPERALKRRMTGEGTIRIEIAADGSLSGFEIVRSTELAILDDELRPMLERASPFPKFPSDLHKNSLALVVPVAFRIGG
jgi:protein TonB